MKIKNLVFPFLSICIISGGIAVHNIYSPNTTEASSFSSKPSDIIENYLNIEKTNSGLNKYKEKINKNNRLLEDKKVKDINVTITFNKPLSDDEIINYVKNYNIKGVQVQGRAIAQSGERVTFSIVFDKINLMKKVKIGLQEEGSKFIGYTDIYAKIDSKDLNQIINDSDTYLVDSSADSYFTNSDENFAHAFTWDLEELNNPEYMKRK